MSAKRSPRIAIVGSGFSGLCLGMMLRRAGIDSFTIFEKEDRLGGTWRDNTYPGAACDVPAMAYCFSFEQKTDWSRIWAPHDEILGYMEECARKYDLLPRIRFDTEVEAARFDADEAVWHVRTADGRDEPFDVLVSGVGQLHRPYVPDLPGLGRFAGPCFHSARWRHDVDLRGKRVGVIGNAASAIQLVPEIAPHTARTLVFQRSPNWMLPRGDRPYTEREHWIFQNVPMAARLHRWWIWLLLELRWPLFAGNEWLQRRVRDIATRRMREVVSSPELQAKLVPDYPVGAKRILTSDDYYRSLEEDPVDLVTTPIDRIEEEAVVTEDGERRLLDALVLATGFDSTHFLAPMEIEGLDGRRLGKEWSEGASAYLGLTVSGFPNFYMMYGPNTNLGHNSILFMIECQSRYILRCIETLSRHERAYLDLDPEVQTRFNRQLADELAATVWAEADHSWYKTSEGRITNNWSGSTTRYWWRTRRPDRRAYRLVTP